MQDFNTDALGLGRGVANRPTDSNTKHRMEFKEDTHMCRSLMHSKVEAQLV